MTDTRLRAGGRRLLLLCLWLALLPACQFAGRRVPDAPLPRRGAVVTEHPLATQVGLALLERGGNAADAAVGAALALAVVYPQAGNLGGGGFALWVPHGRPDAAEALDFRETAPRRLEAAAFLDEHGQVDREKALASHLAVGVPGTPLGLEALHQRHGSLPWAEVVAPALALAREGYRVDPWLARDLLHPTYRERLEACEHSRRVWYPRGEPLGEGRLLRQTDLARTLESLATRGAAGGFYRGPVAERIVAASRAGGGVIDHGDLEGYQVRWREPLRGWFRGDLVLTMPPPSSGGVLLLQVLGILEGFPVESQRARAQADPAAWVEAESGLDERALHWWIEALRRGFADRAEHLGDPDFHAVPLEALLSADWIAASRVAIGERARPDLLPWAPPAAEGGGETTHLCVLDGRGNAVSLTTTLNTSFGTGRSVGGAGFLLNNELDDFALQAGSPNVYGLVGGRANALEPGKRPLSSMTPTVVLAGGRSARLVLGSPGGPRIITAVQQVLVRHLVYGQSIEAAVAAPRLHQQWRPQATFLEPHWPPGLEAALEGRGHQVERSRQRWASVQAIALEPGGEPRVASDPRRGGSGGVVGRPPSVPSLPGEL